MVNTTTLLILDSRGLERTVKKLPPAGSYEGRRRSAKDRTAPYGENRKRSVGRRGRQCGSPAKALMERYAIKAEDVPAASRSPAFRMTWIYWEELLHEFGLQLRHFGHRGNAAIGGDKIVYINLRTSLWWIEREMRRRLPERRPRLRRRIAAHLPQSARKRVLPLQTLTQSETGYRGTDAQYRRSVAGRTISCDKKPVLGQAPSR